MRVFLLVLLFLVPAQVGQAAEVEELTPYWETLQAEYGDYLPKKQITDYLTSSPLSWLQGLGTYLFHELIASGKTLGILVLLAVLSSLLQTLQMTFTSQVSSIAQSVIYLILFTFAFQSFRLTVDYATDIVQSMTNLTIALIPMLLAFLTTTSLFHPLLVFLMNTSGTFVQTIVFPLLLFSAVLRMVGTMSDDYKVDKLASLLNKGAVGSLAAFSAIFLGILGLQGAMTGVADGMGLKATKFVTGNFLPVVGKVLTEATETVFGASMVLRNTIGIGGVILLLLMVAFPALKILALAFVYKVTAALLEPLGNEAMVTCLDIIGKCILYVFACLAIVSLLFFFTLTILITSANISMMVGS